MYTSIFQDIFYVVLTFYAQLIYQLVSSNYYVFEKKTQYFFGEVDFFDI